MPARHIFRTSAFKRCVLHMSSSVNIISSWCNDPPQGKQMWCHEAPRNRGAAPILYGKGRKGKVILFVFCGSCHTVGAVHTRNACVACNNFVCASSLPALRSAPSKTKTRTRTPKWRTLKLPVRHHRRRRLLLTKTRERSAKRGEGRMTFTSSNSRPPLLPLLLLW